MTDRTPPPSEWRVAWRSQAPEPKERLSAQMSSTHGSAGDARAAALAIVAEAYAGEIRISRTDADGTFEEVFTSRWELKCWKVEEEFMPKAIDSRWQAQENMHALALSQYCEIRAVLTSAASAGTIRRHTCRALGQQVRTAFLGR